MSARLHSAGSDPMSSFRFIPVIVACVCLLFLSSCVEFTVQNISDLRVRVQIQTPDGGNYTKSIRSGEYTSAFSDHGGSYTIRIVPDEDYTQLLTRLRDEITRRLFEERDTLTGEEVARLVSNLNEINGLVEETAKPGASCSGTVPDFSAVRAVLVWDIIDADWSISCSIATEDG